MNPVVEIIIPTFNNLQQLVSCLNSIFLSMTGPQANLFRIVVINNGDQKLKEFIKEKDDLKIIDVGKNLGWEGGLKLGLEQSRSPFVVFANDDIRLLTGAKFWIQKMLAEFNDPKVGAVGPSSNFVMGSQNIFFDDQNTCLETKFLIGFCMMVRREALEKAGGIDDTLPGGDDFDLSIRLRDLGYRLLCRRDIFVFHHGAQTGAKVFGEYWNSPQMQEKTNLALIKKHGMFKFWEAMIMGPFTSKPVNPDYADSDVEGDICREFVKGANVLELGCGGRKTVENSVGVDIKPKGDHIPFVTNGNESCLADIQSDVSTEIPLGVSSQDTIIARHILEHCQDTLGTLSVWNRLLKVGGRLIVAVPNQENGNTIVLNPEHLHSFTPSSLEKVGEACGFRKVFSKSEVNGVSFVMVFEKESVPSFSKPKPTVLPKLAQLMEVA